MHAITNFDSLELLNSFVGLLAAFILGSIIGLERQFRQRTAGLRTNVLVCVGAAIFVDMAMRTGGADGAIRVAAYVVSGVGFLGAGVIMREDGGVRGINTAATLWGSAAIGTCAGADLIAEAILATAFVLAANTLLRPLVNAINRIPIDAQASELTHVIHIIAASNHRQIVMADLERLLKSSNYPLAELDIGPFGDDEIEIEATLMATSIDERDMDHLIKQLNRNAKIRQAFWSPRTNE
ncbi:MgtC/SapB family protein [uncultured Paenalcaligenes sp.]|uniref:MgtC/SapB family protein n=1 Tax=uncultured Paenalcaligenes sp. TaxID=1588925 RepID=UPI0026283B26|nr:MgtC/SapB family protein [uncultured Paenalcaligenes sp.]